MRRKTNENTHQKQNEKRLILRLFYGVALLLVIALVIIFFARHNQSINSSSDSITSSEIVSESTSEDFFATYQYSNTFPAQAISDFLASKISSSAERVIPAFTGLCYYFKQELIIEDKSNFQVFVLLESSENLTANLNSYLEKLNEGDYTRAQLFSNNPYSASYQDSKERYYIHIMDYQGFNLKSFVKLDIEWIE